MLVVSSESLKRDLEKLTDKQLQQVSEFIAFLKFQEKRRPMKLDPTALSALAEFAEEDRTLAEEGINDYAAILAQED